MNKSYLYGLVVVIIVVSAVFSLFTKLYLPIHITGRPVQDTGTVTVNVLSGLGISVDPNYNVVNFGTIVRTFSYNTLSNNPKPILIRNDGSITADVQVCASSQFWSSSSKQATDFQFQVDVPGTGIFPLANGGAGADNCGLITSNTCFTYTGTATTATNMPFGSPTCVAANAINNLNYVNTNDEAELNILIHVPADEVAGAKSTQITITGVDPTTIP